MIKFRQSQKTFSFGEFFNSWDCLRTKSDFSNQEKQKEFGKVALLKDLSLLVLRNKGRLFNGLTGGAMFTVGTAAASKAIQKDRERRAGSKESSINIKNTSDSSIKKKQKVYSHPKKISFKGSGSSFVLGAAIPTLGYLVERSVGNNMIKDTASSQETQSNSRKEDNKKNINSPKEKKFSVGAVVRVAKFLPKAAKAKKAIKGVKTVQKYSKGLDFISKWTGGGGYKGVQRVGTTLKAIGRKSGNKSTVKLANTILNNPNTSMAFSIPIGSAITATTYNLGDKVATKVINKVDPTAFNESNSKEQEI